MRRYIKIVTLWLMTALLPLFASAQTASANYVLKRIMLNAAGTEWVETITYCDGLGRPTLTIEGGAGADGPVATLTEYSTLSEASRQWLPIPASSLDFISPADYAAAAADFYSDAYPRTDIVIDALGRTVESWGPGQLWRSASKKAQTQYVFNAANSVREYAVQGSGVADLGFWPAGALRCERAIDEDGRSVETYTDLFGSVVLVRRGDDNDTYFVYNDIGQLRFVLQPEYQLEPDISRFAFRYEYDSLGNVSSKAMPGCDPTRYWYDSGRRLAFSQDPLLAQRGRMRFYLYDNQGRTVAEGTCAYSVPQSSAMASAAFTGDQQHAVFGGYQPHASLSLSAPSLEIASYYDGYGFLAYLSERLPSLPIDSLAWQGGTCAKGMLSGTLMAASNGEPLVDVLYYDSKGRMVHYASIGLGGRLSYSDCSYDFAGRIVSSSTAMSDDGGPATLSSSLQYRQGSLLPLRQDASLMVGQHSAGGAVAVSAYDGVGRLSSLAREGGAGSVAYSYNVRGWTTGISGPGFAEALSYADHPTDPMYSSLISSQTWTDGSGIAEGFEMSYKFAYDRLGRLTDASYSEGYTFAMGDSAIMHRARPLMRSYSERVLEYSPNGLVKRLVRYGDLPFPLLSGVVDDLTMEHDGNRLVRVSDSAVAEGLDGCADFVDGADDEVECFYDGAGSLVRDCNKGIELILYDDRGFPQGIYFSNGAATKFVYSPLGAKLREAHHTPPLATAPGPVPMIPDFATIEFADSADYAGPFVSENGSLRMCLFDGGYFAPEDSLGGWGMRFYTRDHVGNNRAVVDAQGNVLQTVHYYPMGGVYGGSNLTLQPYKQAGKQLMTMHGLGWTDYGFRFHDPTTGTWTTVDPLAEKYHEVSQYAFCNNNPVNKIDVLGLTDFLCEELKKHQYINDGVNQVLEVTTSNYNKLEEIGFDCENSSYSRIISDTTIRTDVQYTIPNVLSDTKYETYGSTGDCLLSAKAQNSISTLPVVNRIDMYNDGEILDFDLGIDYLNDQLSKGESLVAGVYTGHDHGNQNRSTGHFLNIVGRGITYKYGSFVNFYSYYDNASNNEMIGTNLQNNRFIPQKTKNGAYLLYDNKTEHIKNVTSYILTEIRRNNIR